MIEMAGMDGYARSRGFFGHTPDDIIGCSVEQMRHSPTTRCSRLDLDERFRYSISSLSGEDYYQCRQL